MLFCLLLFNPIALQIYFTLLELYLKPAQEIDFPDLVLNPSPVASNSTVDWSPSDAQLESSFTVLERHAEKFDPFQV